MANQNDTGVFQMDNGCWGYRYKINVDGTLKEKRRQTDDFSNPFKTKTSAIKARQQAIMNEKINAVAPTQIKIQRKTVKEVYNEYCEFGRGDKAYNYILMKSHRLYLSNKNRIKYILIDMGKEKIFSLELVNSLDDGKIQIVNSMKYYTQKIKSLCGITFKYHYLRHTYGATLALLSTPMHILCKQMGHASGNVTQKYYLGNSKEGVRLLKANLNKMK